MIPLHFMWLMWVFGLILGISLGIGIGKYLERKNWNNLIDEGKIPKPNSKLYNFTNVDDEYVLICKHGDNNRYHIHTKGKTLSEISIKINNVIKKAINRYNTKL